MKTQTVIPNAKYKRLVKKMELNMCFMLAIIIYRIGIHQLIISEFQFYQLIAVSPCRRQHLPFPFQALKQCDVLIQEHTHI
jgi:hypothetical protein